MVISETRDTHTYCRALSSGAVTTCFTDLGMLRLGFEHPIFRLQGQCSNPLPHRSGLNFENIFDVTLDNYIIDIHLCIHLRRLGKYYILCDIY